MKDKLEDIREEIRDLKMKKKKVFIGKFEIYF